MPDRAYFSDIGPWLATAYPRAGSPAYATPDQSGRLTYDHLLEDKWAHNYRFYIQPVGRYDLLWSSFRQSPLLRSLSTSVPTEEPLQRHEVQPELLAKLKGGLDVVLDRVQPVVAPLVLSSSRLDKIAQPGQPVPPSSIWEVIIAQHPEQSLSERNQTLYRQLSFRQIAFTLLRRFTNPEHIKELSDAFKDPDHEFEFKVKYVQNEYPEIPEQLRLKTDLPAVEEEIARDLPLRIREFQQGAMVLQWRSLPYFYEHRLLLIAQTSSQVSQITEVTQRDFEYISPPPVAQVDAVDSNSPQFPGRLRRVVITLQRLWDCLPSDVQDQWRAEEPDDKGSTVEKRKISSLPDLDVVYQLVETFSGNLEVQVECLFDRTLSPKNYVLRQLGQHFTGLIEAKISPKTETPQADYQIRILLRQITEVAVRRNYPPPTLSQISFANQKFKVERIFTREDRNSILLTSVNDVQRTRLQEWLDNVADDARLVEIFPDETERNNFKEDFLTLDRLYRDWLSEEPITAPLELVNLPSEFAALRQSLTFPTAFNCVLVWQGNASPSEQDALKALEGDQAFKEALTRLANTAATAGENAILREIVPLSIQPIPESLSQQLILQQTNASSASIVWRGLRLEDAQKQVLQQWATLAELVVAVQTLITQLEAVVITKLLTPPRPLQTELPAEIRSQLIIGADSLTWNSPAPTDAQRTALIELRTGAQSDEQFKVSLESLLSLINGNFSVNMPTIQQPQQNALPDSIRSQLQITANSLSWQGPSPTDAQRTVLNGLTGDPEFLTALQQLLANIDAEHRVSMSSLQSRPRQSDLPESLRDQLSLTATQITWRGRVLNNSQLEALRNLTGDQPFTQAVQEMVQELQNREISIPVNISLRPQPDTLPPLLRNKLLIGSALMHYHGLMTIDEGKALLALTTQEPDRQAIRRLYSSSLSRGMQGRTLSLRTRRGSADPSSDVLLQPNPLS